MERSKILGCGLEMESGDSDRGELRLRVASWEFNLETRDGGGREGTVSGNFIGVPPFLFLRKFYERTDQQCDGETGAQSLLNVTLLAPSCSPGFVRICTGPGVNTK